MLGGGDRPSVTSLDELPPNAGRAILGSTASRRPTHLERCADLSCPECGCCCCWLTLGVMYGITAR